KYAEQWVAIRPLELRLWQAFSFSGTRHLPTLISARFPYLEAAVSIGTWSTLEEFYLDTGFDGGMQIPATLLDDILPSPSWVRWRVAHDPIVRAPLWVDTAQVAANSFAVEVAAMGS